MRGRRPSSPGVRSVSDGVNTPEQATRSGSDPKGSFPPGARIILWAGIAVGVLVAVAVAFTFIRSPQLDPATPEGVVQRYLQAVIEGRRAEARSYLSDRLQRECDSRFPRHLSHDAYRIEWMETVVDGSGAEVEVLVAEHRGIFDSYHEFDAFFSLQLSGAEWRITDQEWPWYGCSEPMLDREETR